jgi:hypothetical protein
MAQEIFNPVSGVSTHEDALTIWNGNATDAQGRFVSLEAEKNQNTVSSASGILTIDVSSEKNAKTELTEDITALSFTGAVAGDSGLLIVSQDATASWTVSSTAVVLSGDLADIASITSSTGLGSIGWFFDGSVYTLYISDVT